MPADSRNDVLTVDEFVESMARVEALRDELPDRVDLTDEELLDEVLRLGIVSEPAFRAIVSLAGENRPTIEACVAAAERLGARPAAVAAAFGYIRSSPKTTSPSHPQLRRPRLTDEGMAPDDELGRRHLPDVALHGHADG